MISIRFPWRPLDAHRTKRVLCCLGLFALLSCASSPQFQQKKASPRHWIYQITLTDDFKTIEVNAHNVAIPTARLSYQVALNSHGFDFPFFENFQKRSLLLPTSLWLKAPASKNIDLAELHFVLPKNTQISVPWPKGSRGYMVQKDAFLFESYALFGEFEKKTFSSNDATFSIARLHGLEKIDWQNIEAWLTSSARAVASLFGEFPRKHVQVLLVSSGWSRDTVQLGLAGRGGNASVLFFLAKNATPDALRKDWVATHELSHFVTPYVKRSDMWISEGIATYYQEVLRLRAGLQSPEQAWSNLYLGMRAGQNGGTGRTLREESKETRRTRAYRRVYWAGAAMAMTVDIMSRMSSDNHKSLDSALQELYKCCGTSKRAWSAEQMASRMDHVFGQSFWGRMTARYLDSVDFPEVNSWFRLMGINRKGKAMEFDDNAPLAFVRKAIEQP
ncbi:MAG: hypothetical protein IPJ88_12620 [Myxococcales bacterium]|nr:MAG: hypothetical protein IPJ88_12620 [Myxococcales bacterium]